MDAITVCNRLFKVKEVTHANVNIAIKCLEEFAFCYGFIEDGIQRYMFPSLLKAGKPHLSIGI